MEVSWIIARERNRKKRHFHGACSYRTWFSTNQRARNHSVMVKIKLLQLTGPYLATLCSSRHKVMTWKKERPPGKRRCFNWNIYGQLQYSVEHCLNNTYVFCCLFGVLFLFVCIFLTEEQNLRLLSKRLAWSSYFLSYCKYQGIEVAVFCVFLFF